MPVSDVQEQILEREAIANRPKHWVRCVTACNSRCLFCLDSDTPRNVIFPVDEVKAEILRGRTELNAWKIILSGGEAALHPQYVELIRYAKEVGYGRIQTVTNGWRYADKSFFDACMEAGLQELTFSLHGHNKERHEQMTVHPGSFDRIIKAIVRAKKHPSRPIVSIDVCINKQNVSYLDKILELGISLGVTEYDLLHVIPQAAAYENREQLFYDPKDHLEMLHKVFRLNRHPRFVIWTNRFPVAFLEGMEDLIQDPHKMLDEVNGRRFQVRKYLDTGKPLDCRQTERCQHCFIEPFCTTMDRAIRWQNDASWDVWRPSLAFPGSLPFGCRWLAVDDASSAPVNQTVYLRSDEVKPIDGLAQGSIIVAHQTTQLDAWFPSLSDRLEMLIELNQETAPWLLAHRDLLQTRLSQVRIHQPSHEKMGGSMESDVRDPARFFRALNLPIRTSGLPACLCPGAVLVEALRILDEEVFVEGRFDVQGLARYHVQENYLAKSVRCRDCVVKDRCEGAHINFLRDQGLGQLSPLMTGPWAVDAQEQLKRRYPVPEKRLGNGRMFEPIAASLPGYTQPAGAAEDPLSIIARNVAERRAKRREEIRARIVEKEG